MTETKAIIEKQNSVTPMTTQMNVTQAAAEVFASMIPPQMRMTQGAIEVWASVAPTVVLPRQRAHILA